MPKVPKMISLHNFCNISRKTWGMKLIFGADNIKSLLQVDTIIFGGLDQAYRKYSKWVWDIFGIYQEWKVMKLIFCMLINIKFSANWYYFFDGFGQACPKYSDKFAISHKRSWEYLNFFVVCIDLLNMGIISFICQSKTITND